MPESATHRNLKHTATRWLWHHGYAAIAEEVVVPGVGIIDVAAAGIYRKRNPRKVAFELEPRVDRHHVVFVECKAFRADFLRDQGQQMQFAFALEEKSRQRKSKRRYAPRHASPAMGKFDTCLIRPHANLHYLMTIPRVVKANEIPRRWGLLVVEHGRVRVVRKAAWQEVAQTLTVEAAIARSLTAQKMRRTVSTMPFHPIPNHARRTASS